MSIQISGEKVLEVVHEYLYKWWTILILWAVVYIIVDWFTEQWLLRKLRCRPVNTYVTDGVYGLKFMIEMLGMKSKGTMVDYARERYDIIGADTFKFRIGGSKMVSTKDPENIKAMLATQFNDFALGLRHAQFKPLLGDGIFTLDGEGWKHSRAMLRPQFAREQVSHVRLLEPHFQVLAKHIKKSNGAPFDIQPLFFRLTLDSATEFLFGASVNSLWDESVGMETKDFDVDGKANFAEAFNGAQNWLASRAITQKLYFLVTAPSFRRQVAQVHKFADFYVHKALEASPEELEEKSKEGYIFSYELAKQTRNPKILRDQLLNILLAGRDTTAGLLSFTMFELSKNPRVWNKLKEEIYQNFGSGDNCRIDDITFESLKKCEYLKAVLNEALRMYPSVPQNFRVATRNTSLPRGGGPTGMEPCLIRKGQTVVYSIFATHRDPKYYGKDVDEFRPERWFEETTRKLGWAFLPFNGGPRICLGQQFALTEASYILTRLIQEFPTLGENKQEYPPKKNSHLTMSHMDGVFVSLV